MTGLKAFEMIDYLNKRMKPCCWWQWGIDITWEKLEKWYKRLK